MKIADRFEYLCFLQIQILKVFRESQDYIGNETFIYLIRGFFLVFNTSKDSRLEIYSSTNMFDFF
jgi:hypothetical protein